MEKVPEHLLPMIPNGGLPLEYRFPVRISSPHNVNALFAFLDDFPKQTIRILMTSGLGRQLMPCRTDSARAFQYILSTHEKALIDIYEVNVSVDDLDSPPPIRFPDEVIAPYDIFMTHRSQLSVALMETAQRVQTLIMVSGHFRWYYNLGFYDGFSGGQMIKHFIPPRTGRYVA